MDFAGTALVVALASAALMGAAIQRGATCMVAAVDEMVGERRYGRALALAEAAIWVGGLVALAQLAGVSVTGFAVHPVGIPTVLGGVLLGLGAWINRACVFGAVARIGRGQIAWIATPVGFFLGSLVPFEPSTSGSAGPITGNWALATGAAFVFLACWRLSSATRAPSIAKYLWHPQRATLVIGVTFFSTLLTAGAWAYTDALADLARMMDIADARLLLRGAMVLALLAGAVVGGHLTGGLAWQRPDAVGLLRCFAGGTLLGAGAVLVPGSNDGLIMLGLPLLVPHAWVAVGIMTLTIAGAILMNEALQKPVEA